MHVLTEEENLKENALQTATPNEEHFYNQVFIILCTSNNLKQTLNRTK